MLTAYHNFFVLHVGFCHTFITTFSASARTTFGANQEYTTVCSGQRNLLRNLHTTYESWTSVLQSRWWHDRVATVSSKPQRYDCLIIEDRALHHERIGFLILGALPLLHCVGCFTEHCFCLSGYSLRWRMVCCFCIKLVLVLRFEHV